MCHTPHGHQGRVDNFDNLIQGKKKSFIDDRKGVKSGISSFVISNIPFLHLEPTLSGVQSFPSLPSLYGAQVTFHQCRPYPAVCIVTETLEAVRRVATMCSRIVHFFLFAKIDSILYLELENVTIEDLPFL